MKIRYWICEDVYAWNPSIGLGGCDKDFKIDEWLKNCNCIKSLVDDLVVTCDEVVDTPKSTPISPSDGINYCLIHVVLLSIVGFLLFLAIVVKYYMKHGLIISRLLSYSLEISRLREINIKKLYVLLFRRYNQYRKS